MLLLKIMDFFFLPQSFVCFGILKDRFPPTLTFLRSSMECSKMAATWITIFSNTEHDFKLSEIGTYYTRLHYKLLQKKIMQVFIVLDYEVIWIGELDAHHNLL